MSGEQLHRRVGFSALPQGDVLTGSDTCLLILRLFFIFFFNISGYLLQSAWLDNGFPNLKDIAIAVKIARRRDMQLRILCVQQGQTRLHAST